MTKIVYTGPSDFRELDSADLKKADVSGFRKTSFPRGRAVNIDAKAARAILDDTETYGNFEEATDKNSTEDEVPTDQIEGPAGTDIGADQTS